MSELRSKRIHLRQLSAADATERYASWLNDPVVNRFLEARYLHHTAETCRSFIESINADSTSYLFGIFTNDGCVHIGNIKLGPIDARYGSGQLGLFIGEREFWGAGYATEAITRIAQHAFEDLDLFRLEAGCYEDNLGSLRAFLKSGFTVEGFYRKKFLIDEKRTSSFLLGLLRDEWIAERI